MPILRFVLLLLTISAATPSLAQLTPKRKTELDEYARKTPAVHARNTRSLVDYLVKPAQNDLEKVRLIFTWVALHIQYNDAAFNSGNIPDQSAKAIMKSKSAVCEGFSNLFEDLLQEAGFETKHITGYSKGFGYKTGENFKETNHAWSAVKVGGQWLLMDPTWGGTTSSAANGKLKTKNELHDIWFNTSPETFVMSHLPSDTTHQYLPHAISKKTFEAWPYVSDDIAGHLAQPKQFSEQLQSGKITSLPEVYELPDSVQFVDMPWTKTLKKKTKYHFAIDMDSVEEIFILEGTTSTPMANINGVWTLDYTPTSGDIEFFYRPQGTTTAKGIVRYDVK